MVLKLNGFLLVAFNFVKVKENGLHKVANALYPVPIFDDF